MNESGISQRLCNGSDELIELQSGSVKMLKKKAKKVLGPEDVENTVPSPCE